MKKRLILFALPILLIPALALAQITPNKSSSSNSTTASGSTVPVTSNSCDSKFSIAGVFQADGLLPPFLRSAKDAQNADFSAVCITIDYYTKFLLVVVAFAAFLYLLYGSFQYMTAFGEDAKAQQAKKTITTALIGLVLATLAYAIVSIVKSILKA